MSNLTRQAITKHLGVLTKARLVRAQAVGRERLDELNLLRIAKSAALLDLVPQQWEEALVRLRAFVQKRD